MKRNHATLAFALVLGLAVHLGLVDFYRSRVFADGVPERTEAQYEPLREAVRTLIVGNSHAKWGIASPDLDSAFNLSLDGETVPETYYILRNQLDDPALDVRVVVMAADPVSFSYWRRRGMSARYWYAPRVDYLAIGRERGELARYARAELLGRFAPYVGMRSDILHYLATGTNPHLPMHRGVELVRGTFTTKASFADLSRAEREEFARNRILFHFPAEEFDEVAGDYFRRTLELTRDRGVTTVVVRLPATREYLLAARPFLDGSRVYERIDAILGDHPQVRVLDTRLDFVDQPELFVDSDHLNERGARRIARRIRKLLARPEG